MELHLVNFKQAIALKELGFPQDISQSTSYGEYDEDGDFWGLDQYYGEISYAAPTLELVAKWLREEKNIWVNVWADSEDNEHNKFNTVFYEQVCYGKDNKIISNKGIFVHLTYEEALSAGIDKAIEILNLSSKFTH